MNRVDGQKDESLTNAHEETSEYQSLPNRLAIGFALLAILTSLSVIVVTYFTMSHQLRQRFREKAIDVVSAAALAVDTDAHANLISSEDESSAIYEQIERDLRDIREAVPDIRFVYTLRQREDGQMVFVVDAKNDFDEGFRLGDVYDGVSHLGDTPGDSRSALNVDLGTLDHAVALEKFYGADWGSGLTAYAPLRTIDGRQEGVLAIDFTTANVLAREWVLVGSVVAVFALTIPIVVGLGWFMGRRIAAPIMALTVGAQHIAEGDLDYEVQVQSQDEIAILAEAFNRMTGQLRGLIGNLELRVSERTAELARRAAQLQAVTEVSRAVGSILNINELLDEVVNQALDRFQLYYVGVFLVDEEREYAWLKAGTGEAGKEMLARQHKLAVGETSMIGWCVKYGKARIALDVGEDAVRFNNPLLPDTRSEMALPLITRGEVIGALTVQSDEPQAFSEEDITVLQTMADQLAGAIGNAHLYEESQQALSEAQQLQQRYLHEVWDTYLRKQRDVVGYLAESGEVRSVAEWQTPEMRQALEKQTLVTLVDEEIGRNRAALAMPLKLREETIGILNLYQEDASRAWSDNDQMLVEVISEQLVLALENARLFDQTQDALSLSERLYEASRRIMEAQELKQIYQTLIDECVWYGVADHIILALAEPEPVFEPEYLKVVLTWSRDEDTDVAKVGTRYSTVDLPLLKILPSPTESGVISDLAAESRLDDAARRSLVAGLGIHSMVNVPLASGGDWFGILVVQTHDVREFAEEELRFYRSLADRAAMAMQTRRLLAVTANRARREQLAREITTKMRGATDVEKIMQVALHELRDALGVSHAGIRLGGADVLQNI